MITAQDKASISTLYIATIVLVALSLPPFSFTWAGVIVFVPFFIACQKDGGWLRDASAAAIGAGIGAYAFLGTVSYSPVLYGLLVLLFGAIYTIYGVVASTVLSRQRMAPVFLGLSWCASEYLLNQHGLPYSHGVYLASDIWLIQLADIGGQNFVAGLSMMFQAAVARRLANFNSKSTRDKWRNTDIYITVSLAVVVVAYGALRLNTANTSVHSISVAAVQSNIPPVIYMQSQRDGGLEAMDRHRRRLVDEIASLDSRPDIVIWPELSFAGFEFRHSTTVQEMAGTLGIDMLAYSADLNPDGTLTSAVFGVASADKAVSRHGKMTTVPLAEADFSKAGNHGAHPHVVGNPLSMICLESALPMTVDIDDIKQSRLLAVSVNDAYAGPSFLPMIHVEFAKFRAIEVRRPLVRSANSGQSAIIASTGQILASLPGYRDGILPYVVDSPTTITFYAKYGNNLLVLIMLAGIAIMTFALCSAWRERRKTSLSGSVGAALVILAIGSIATVSEYVFARAIVFEAIEKSGAYAGEFSSDVLPIQMFASLNGASPEGIKLVALCYLLRRHGLAVTVDQLRDRGEISNDPLYDYVVNMATLAESFGYTLQRRSAADSRFYLPSIVQLRNGTAVVAIRANWSEVTIFDPLQAREVRISKDAFMDSWTGEYYRLVSRVQAWDATP